MPIYNAQSPDLLGNLIVPNNAGKTKIRNVMLHLVKIRNHFFYRKRLNLLLFIFKVCDQHIHLLDSPIHFSGLQPCFS
jgi:hypothetical protein